MYSDEFIHDYCIDISRRYADLDLLFRLVFKIGIIGGHYDEIVCSFLASCMFCLAH